VSTEALEAPEWQRDPHWYAMYCDARDNASRMSAEIASLRAESAAASRTIAELREENEKLRRALALTDARFRETRDAASAAESLLAEARAVVEPFASVPLNGTFGGPLVGAQGLYEDGSDAGSHKPDRSLLGHEPFRAARTLRLKLQELVNG
jgi:hypothetical protein